MILKPNDFIIGLFVVLFVITQLLEIYSMEILFDPNGYNVDAGYCLHLTRRQDRYKAVKAELIKHHVSDKIKFFEGIDWKYLHKDVMKAGFSPGMIACAMSYRKIWLDALKNGHKRILVIEDDFIAADHINQYLTDALLDLPECDFLYLGCNGANDTNRKGKFINGFFSEVADVHGFYGYIIMNQDAMYKLLSFTENLTEQIDNQLCHQVFNTSELIAVTFNSNIIFVNGLPTDVQTLIPISF